MQIPYSVEDLRSATNELIGVNGLPECYIRPIAFYGYGQLGVATRGNPVETVIMSWPWGTYLGEDGLKSGITAKVSSWQRVSPNIVPHVSKATGVYLNSMLAVSEANFGGYDEAILLTPEGLSPTAPARTSRRARRRALHARSRGILGPYPRRGDPDRGRTWAPRGRSRSSAPTHLADEVFMCGTAAEVTPLRAIDHELGVSEVTLEIRMRIWRRSTDRPTGGRSASASAARENMSVGSTELNKERRHRLCRRAEHVASATSIAPSAPWIDERDEELVLAVLRWLSLGPTGPRFESLLAAAVDAPQCAAVSSGTAGLHLCMRLAGVGSGDEVITSPYSFVASANCAIYEGATPVFADIDRRTLNLDPAAVEAAITPRTKAIMPVHLGYPQRFRRPQRPGRRHGLMLVEDRGGPRSPLQGTAARRARTSGGVGVLSEQADDDG
jgi:branched-chain amino acid aminotransferase